MQKFKAIKETFMQRRFKVLFHKSKGILFENQIVQKPPTHCLNVRNAEFEKMSPFWGQTTRRLVNYPLTQPNPPSTPKKDTSV